MRSNMVHSFANVPRVDIPRSRFNRSHRHVTSFDADDLIPIFVDDVIPGDTFSCDCNFVARLTSPTLLPLMDNMYLETFFFFVPYRLVWDNWEKFCGAQDDPADSIDFTIPTSAATYTAVSGDIFDYFGMPIGVANVLQGVSMLPFRAYNLIYNEWFRDQNLIDSVTVNTGNGPDTAGTYSILKRGKRHDYFTSALPWPQKGDAVPLPLGSRADIFTDQVGTATPLSIYATDDSEYRQLTSSTSTIQKSSATGAGASERLYADLATATAANINDIRLAFQTQRLLERDARSGTRYVETILAHYGVTVPDFRVQRPEFLGGGSSRVNVSPVAQTTYQGTQTIQDAKGALGGVGSVSGTHGFTKSFVEHGVIIGLANVRADIMYYQGIERYWKKDTRFDFYYPVLSQIGEQSIRTDEIYYQNSAADDDAWGYQERYAEYRYKPSRLSGLARPGAGNLDPMTLVETFSSQPTLGQTFIESNTAAPLDRAVSVPSEDQFIADFFFDLKCARPMPVYGVPGGIDHF